MQEIYASSQGLQFIIWDFADESVFYILDKAKIHPYIVNDYSVEEIFVTPAQPTQLTPTHIPTVVINGSIVYFTKSGNFASKLLESHRYCTIVYVKRQGPLKTKF